ncbi:unnamed protein product [Discula destructiva]
MRFATIFVPFLASVAMATPNGLNMARGGGGGGGGSGGSGTTVTVTTTAPGSVTTVGTGGGSGGAAYNPCPDLIYGNAACCTFDLLNLVALACEPAPEVPTDADDFSAICKSTSYPGAFCCGLTLLGTIDVLCETPVGVTN